MHIAHIYIYMYIYIYIYISPRLFLRISNRTSNLYDFILHTVSNMAITHPCKDQGTVRYCLEMPFDEVLFIQIETKYYNCHNVHQAALIFP